MRSKDGYLIQKCLAGDAAAFGILVDKYKASIYALAYAKLCNFHDAEDVTQEVFIKAYEKLYTLKGWDNFYAWLYSITSNRCKMWLRSRENRPDREYLEEQDEATVEKPSLKSHQEKMMYEMIGDALENLSEIYRQVLSLYYLGGMNTREIAEFLRISPETIKSRLKRARLVLKEEMIAMMNTTFDEMKLQPSFTFRIVEAIKGTKIQAPPSKMTLPFGASVAAGLIALLLSLAIPQSPLYPIGELIGSALPSQMQVPEIGVIPVDMVEVTEITILTSEKDDGDFGQKPKPERINVFAPGGEERKWEKGADMPTARETLTTATVNRKIYAIGGKNGGFLATVEKYDPKTNRWTEKADMPTSRGYLASAVLNEKIYAIGGLGQRGTLATVEEYDPKTNRWTKRANMPTPRSSLAAVAVDGKIYAIGGWNRNSGGTLATVEEYDPKTNRWTKRANMPTPRDSLAAVAVDGKIYAVGGKVMRILRPGAVAIELLPTVEVYDPETGTWTRATDMPTKRDSFAISAVNKKLYAIGGGFHEHLSVVEEYTLAADTWVRLADMPTARGELSASAVDGRIYVVGGDSEDRGIVSRVEVFDTGFRQPQNVNPAGKLTTMWGEIKAAR